MTFKIDRKKFINVLSVGGSLSSYKNSLSILAFAKVKVNEKQVVVSSYNGNTYVTRRDFVEEADGECEFCVSSSQLIKSLKAIGDKSVKLKVDESITVIHSKGRMKIPVETSEDFPNTERSDSETEINVEVDEFLSKLQLAMNFCAKDILRPILTGVLISVDNNKMTICASDGNKLFLDALNVQYSGEPIRSIINHECCQQVENAIYDSQNMRIAISDRSIRFTGNNARVEGVLIDGRYPNVNSVIPQNNSIAVTANTGELIAATQRAQLFSGASNAIRVEIAGEQMKLTAEDIEFAQKSEDSMEVEHTGSDITIGIKAETLNISLSCIESDKVSILMESNDRAIVYKDKENEERIILQMPSILNR